MRISFGCVIGRRASVSFAVVALGASLALPGFGGAASAAGSRLPWAGVPSPPLDSCLPNNYWVGFNDGNIDLNLFYETTGTLTLSNGCHVADEPLTISNNGSASGVPAQVVVPPGITATVGAPITIYTGGVLEVSCPGGVYPVWKSCTSTKSGHLFDNAYPVVILSGEMDVAPGATVNMENAGIYIKSNGGTAGALNVQDGTIEGPVGSPAVPGGWAGIDFLDGSVGSIIDSTISGGGGDWTAPNDCSQCKADVLVEGTAGVSIADSTIANSALNGVESAAGYPSLSSDKFTYCTSCGFAANTGSPLAFDTVPGPLTSGAGTGQPLLSDLTSAGYGHELIAVPAGTLSSSGSWPDAGLPYALNGAVQIGNGGGLKLLPGVTLLVSSTLTVDDGGNLTIAGSPSAPVNVTSVNDVPGAATAPQPGDWTGVTFQTGSAGAIDFARISYAGHAGAAALSTASLSGPLDVTNSTISTSGGDDVAVASGSGPVLTRDTFGPVPNGHYAVDDTRPAGAAVAATRDYWSRSGGPGATSGVHGSVLTSPYEVQTQSVLLSGVASLAVLGSYGQSGAFGASASGSGFLGVDDLSANPSPSASLLGSPSGFFDVYAWSGSQLSSVTIKDCKIAASQVLLYLDGTAWSPVSGQTTSDANGCIAVTITASSTPSIDTLQNGGITFTDGLIPTVTTLSVSPTSPVYGNSVTLTAQVTSSFGSPIGSVAFSMGKTLLGSTSLEAGKAVLKVHRLAAGAHAFSALFTPVGSTAYVGSPSGGVDVTVRPAPLKVRLNLEMEYGARPLVSGIPATSPTVAYHSFVYRETAFAAITGKLTCTTAATRTSKPGTYAITGCAGLSARNYSLRYQTGALTVTLAGTSIAYRGWSASGKKGSFSTFAALDRRNSGYLSAALTSDLGKPAQGRTLVFTLGSGNKTQKCLALTNAHGVAICKVGKVSVADGKQPLKIAFAGDAGKSALFKASVRTTKIRVKG